MNENYAATYNRNRVTWLYEVARSPDLSHVAVRVGLLFATFMQAESREEVKPSYEWIMKTARIKGRSTVSRALKELEGAGFLEIERFHRFKSHYAMPFDGDAIWSPTLSPKNGL